MLENTKDSQPGDSQRTFDEAKRSGDAIASKYDASDDPRAREQIRQYRQLAADLAGRFRTEPDNQTALAREMRDVDDELGDVLTRRTHNRSLERPNRFDTPGEQQEVRRQSADYHRFLRKQRAEAERASQEADERWLNELHLEVPFRLVMSGAQGGDETISGAVKRLAPHIDVLKIVKSDRLEDFKREIDRQCAENGYLTEDTKQELKKMKKALE